MKHIPVFKNKLVPSLDVQPEGVYLDATLGAGGHAQQILSGISDSGKGKLIACDVDAEAIKNFAREQKQALDAGKLVLKQENFNHLQAIVSSEVPEGKVDGIIADLGWSTDQLEHIPGLSFQQEEAVLDMRLDPSLNQTAAELLNSASDKQLQALFTQFADSDRNELKLLTQAIIGQRKSFPFQKVRDLNQVLGTIKSRIRRSHNLEKRVYQALRIVVNHEYESLTALIQQSNESLAPKGRLLIITFHSGEENIVEDQLTHFVESGEMSWLWPQMPYLQPQVSELRQNFQAHSAKLWGVTKN